jgi:hypothetical protein
VRPGQFAASLLKLKDIGAEESRERLEAFTAFFVSDGQSAIMRRRLAGHTNDWKWNSSILVREDGDCDTPCPAPQYPEAAMIRPSLSEIEELASHGSVIPVRKDILGDLLTPAAAFLRVAQGRQRVFLLESVEGGERLARYSFIGWDPFLVIRGTGNSITIEEMGETSH